MGSQEGTSGRRKVGRTREYRMGMDTELLAIDGGERPVSLFVLCGERFDGARLLRSGGLSVHMIRVEGQPVSMASCTVGDHQWMLARDALVVRLDSRVFVFELPGFFYAVVVPPADDGAGGSERNCGTLAEIFSRFCAYHDLSAVEARDEAGGSNQHISPWVRAHARIQRLKLTVHSGQAMPDGGAGRQIERAIRTSAVVKLLSRSLLAGALQPARHLNISFSSATVSAALPSRLVVADLLDAIETGRSAPGRAAGHGQDSLGWWRVNVEGVMLLLRVIQAVRGEMVKRRDSGDKEAAQRGRQRTRRAERWSRRWCGGGPGKLENAVGPCGSS